MILKQELSKPVVVFRRYSILARKVDYWQLFKKISLATLNPDKATDSDLVFVANIIEKMKELDEREYFDNEELFIGG
ncbi:MAG: hypothetical protein HY929_02615 [Euryarchaeota archaeon]|nr:hypothetical protein [Euryarchaeota archaeon]